MFPWHLRAPAHIRFLVAAAAVALGVAASAAQASSSGVIGQSGKFGTFCDSCHSGGVAPTVSFDGPQEMAAGATATFHFTVQSAAPATQVAAGFNVASSDGKLDQVEGQGEIAVGPAGSVELTHTSPKDNVDAVASWEFTWTAPLAAGTQTLFGAGNSVNLSRDQTGDLGAATTYWVNVVAGGATGTPTPSATATPTLTQSPTPPPTATPTPQPLPGDANCDGVITAGDLPAVLQVWDLGMPGSCGGADATCDGSIDLADLNAAIDIIFGEMPPPGCPLPRSFAGPVALPRSASASRRATQRLAFF